MSSQDKKHLKLFEKYSYWTVIAIIILLVIISALIGAALQWFVFGVDDKETNVFRYNDVILVNYSGSPTPVPSAKDCPSDCDLGDANQALTEAKELNNYTATLETGWTCLQTNEVKFHQGNVAVTVTNLAGDTNLCEVTLGTEQRLVNGVTYHNLPELDWQQGPLQDFARNEIIIFSEQTLDNYLPAQELSGSTSSYETDYATIYYRDQLVQASESDLELFPDAAYSVHRLRGIDQSCFADGLSENDILGLDCGYIYYVLSEDMNYLGTYIRGSEAIVNYKLVSTGETEVITAPKL